MDCRWQKCRSSERIARLKHLKIFVIALCLLVLSLAAFSPAPAHATTQKASNCVSYVWPGSNPVTSGDWVTIYGDYSCGSSGLNHVYIITGGIWHSPVSVYGANGSFSIPITYQYVSQVTNIATQAVTIPASGGNPIWSAIFYETVYPPSNCHRIC